MVEDRRRQAALLVEQRQQQVLDVDLLMVQLGRQPLGRLQGFERFFGEAVQVHGRALREIGESNRGVGFKDFAAPGSLLWQSVQ